MFNVTVLKMKDIIKYFAGIIITIILVIYISKHVPFVKNDKKEENNKQSKMETIQLGSLTSCLDKTIPTMSSINENYNKVEGEKEETESTNYLEEILKTEISTIKGIEKLKENNNLEMENKQTEESGNTNNQQETQKAENTEALELASTETINTEVVTPNPITESYNVQYGKVKIKNQTSYTLTEEMLKPDIMIDNKNILIFHTHSCESYTSSEKYPYTQTGNYRSTDLKYTVTRVGTELENYLKQYGINVIHDTSYHDYPAYNGSYTRSLQTVENILTTESSDIIIDLHRDAIGSRSDYAPTVKIGDDYAAQIMFVIRNK